MKNSIFRLSLYSFASTTLLSFSSVALASPMLANPNALAQMPSFELTLGALYLKPSSSNLDYAVLGYPFPVLSPHWDVEAVNPSHSYGFDLRGRYRFADTDCDLALTWDHLRTSDSDSTQVALDSGQFVVFPFQAGPSFGQTLNDPSQKAQSTVKFYYDVVNLDMGKTIFFDPATQMRFFFGLSAARLKQHISTTFSDIANTFSINSTNYSKFTGIGPLVGVDASHQFSSGIGFFGSLAASALVGTLDASTNYASTSPQLTASGITTNYQSINPKNSTQGIPGVDGKIGVDYNFGSNDFAFIVALGYQYATYFNAIATYNPSLVASNVNTGSIALSSLSKTMSNYTVQGFFLNFTLAC